MLSGLQNYTTRLCRNIFRRSVKIDCDTISAVCIIPGYIQEMLFMGDAWEMLHWQKNCLCLMKGDSRRWEKLDDEEISHLMLAPNQAVGPIASLTWITLSRRSFNSPIGESHLTFVSSSLSRNDSSCNWLLCRRVASVESESILYSEVDLGGEVLPMVG